MSNVLSIGDYATGTYTLNGGALTVNAGITNNINGTFNAGV